MAQKQINSFPISGKLLEIHQPRYISPKLTIRQFTLEIWTGTYSNPVVFDLRNERSKMLDDLKEGNWVIVEFELMGRKVIREDTPPRYYNALNCTNIIKG